MTRLLLLLVVIVLAVVRIVAVHSDGGQMLRIAETHLAQRPSCASISRALDLFGEEMTKRPCSDSARSTN